MTPEAAAVRQILADGRVPGDAVLVVHSAFKGLRRAGYRAEVFLDALLERMKAGTVVMPAMCWRTVTPAQPCWDELATASHVGVLSELFRTRYAEHRSLHPTHSASALGPAASVLLAGHHLDPTPCSANSPWGKLAGAQAYILLLGIGFERCTALHHPEEVVAPDFYLRPATETEIYRCTTRGGAVHAVRLRRHLRLDRRFPQYTRRLQEKNRLVVGNLSGTPWQLVRAEDLLADAFANLRERREAHVL